MRRFHRRLSSWPEERQTSRYVKTPPAAGKQVGTTDNAGPVHVKHSRFFDQPLEPAGVPGRPLTGRGATRSLNGDTLKLLIVFASAPDRRADRLIRNIACRDNGLLKDGAKQKGDPPDGSKKFKRATQRHDPHSCGDGDGLRVLYRRCQRLFGPDRRIDHIGGSPRTWARSWSWLGAWSRLGPWPRLGSWSRLGLHRAGLLLQPALGPRHLPVLIAGLEN